MTKAERIKGVYAHDEALWDKGLCFAGIDEAGRGPLAGCVTAACVVMPRAPRIEGVYDSKALSEKQRELLYDQILRHAIFVGTGRAEAREIDGINILQATKLAMRRAAAGAPVRLFLIDAVTDVGLDGEERAIIHGDAVSYAIAAASIVAKVSRDREMQTLDRLYPAYGFASHKGYGTKAHAEAVRAFGPCPEHRMTFLKRILR